MDNHQGKVVTLESSLAERPFSAAPVRGRRSQLLPYRVRLLKMWVDGDTIEAMVAWLATYDVHVSTSQVSRFVRKYGGESRKG